MEKFNTEQRTKIIEFYFENQHSIILTQRAYRRHYNVRQAPNQTTINRLVKRFRQHGSVSDLPRTGRPLGLGVRVRVRGPLWGYLKERVYVNKPRTIPELKDNIRREIQELEPVILRKVMENALTRARICEAENGGHLKDIIFKN